MTDTYTKQDIKLDENRPGHTAKKWECPGCRHKKKYVRYYDFTKGEYLPFEYGRCDREDNCGYFNKLDADFFKTGEIQPYSAPVLPRKKAPVQIDYIHKKWLIASVKASHNSIFCKWLAGTFGNAWATQLIEKYFIGGSKEAAGVIFWQIDKAGKIRTGKKMRYKSDGHRTGNEYFIHKSLYGENFNRKLCFFGEHLLKDAKPGSTIAIVESEKTAVVASYFFRQYTWLATGGKHLLDLSKAKVLNGYKVVLFPDLEDSARQKWEVVAADMDRKFGIKTIVSDYMNHINDGSDIADILLNHPIDKHFGNILNELGYPAAWD